MSDTLETLTRIIRDICEIEGHEIVPEASIQDLGIDSLDFMDVAFEVEQEFGVKLPVEEWMESVNDGRAAFEDYFVVGRIAGHIDRLQQGA